MPSLFKFSLVTIILIIFIATSGFTAYKVEGSDGIPPPKVGEYPPLSKQTRSGFIAHKVEGSEVIPPLAANENDKEIIDHLLSSNKSEVDDALSYISIHKPLGILPIICSVILSNDNAWKKDIAVKAIKLYPQQDTTAYCVDILKNTNSFIVKKEIINYVSGSSDRETVPLIINELVSPFSTVRESAILALKKIGDDRMFPYILNMMDNPDPIFKVYALEAICHLYDLRFYNHLINMLKDENKSIRYYVLKCIEINKLQEALRSVRNTACNDNDWEVRVKAIQVLESLSDKDSIGVLLTCLKDINKEIRYYSSKALKRLQFRASAKYISLGLYSESDDDVKAMMIDALIAIKDAGGYKGIKKIILEDKNYKIRVLAAYALGIIKRNYSESLLLNSVNDKSKEVRAEICNSLGFYNSRKVINELLTVINEDSDRYVRSAALFSIKRIGGKFLILPLFERYTVENDPVFKEQIKYVLRELINKI